MDTKRTGQDSKKVWDAVYFFTGEDEFRKNLSINKLKTKLSLTSKSLDSHIYYGKDASFDDITHSLKTPPFLANRRLVILKEAEKLSQDDKEKLISYLKKPAKTSIFVIETEKSLNAKDRFNIAARRYAKAMDFSMLDEDKIFSWIKKEFRLRGKEIEPEAVKFLTGNTSGNLAAISQCIEMASLYTGKRKDVSRKDVEALIGESAKISVFKLVDEISFKKQKSALKILLTLMQSGKDAHQILGLLAWYIRRLGRVKVLVKKGNFKKEQIARSLKVNYYIAGNIINQAKNFTLGEIKRAQQLLIETDMGLKKSISKPQVLLEILVMRLSSG